MSSGKGQMLMSKPRLPSAKATCPKSNRPRRLQINLAGWENGTGLVVANQTSYVSSIEFQVFNKRCLGGAFEA